MVEVEFTRLCARLLHDHRAARTFGAGDAPGEQNARRRAVDGKPQGVRLLGASDQSLSARCDDNIALGRHTMSIESGGQQSNKFQADIVTVQADPIPPTAPGALNTVRVHVRGLPPGERATMFFQVGGAATLANGGATTSVPVNNGLAEVQIRGVHTGEVSVRFELQVALPGFASTQSAVASMWSEASRVGMSRTRGSGERSRLYARFFARPNRAEARIKVDRTLRTLPRCCKCPVVSAGVLPDLASDLAPAPPAR